MSPLRINECLRWLWVASAGFRFPVIFCALTGALNVYDGCLYVQSFALDGGYMVYDGYRLNEEGEILEQRDSEAEDFLTESLETLPDAAALYAERGRIRNLRGDKKGAFDDVKKSIELNPQGEMAQLCNGQHSNFDNLYKGGIF